MTLIIGIKCEDGIVVGADGMATYGTPGGQTTIKQQTVKKLQIIRDQVILGVAGPVGLGQSYFNEIDAAFENKPKGKPIWPTTGAARGALQDAMRRHAKPAFEMAVAAQPVLGNAVALEVDHGSLVAYTVSGSTTPCLTQFSRLCLPEDVTTFLPFVSIGSGQASADPFLAFVRRLFWPENLPTMSQGVLAALWTLRYCIDSQASGIGDPIQIVTLQRENGTWKAIELPEEELREDGVMIEAMESEMKKYIEMAFSAKPSTPMPA